MRVSSAGTHEKERDKEGHRERAHRRSHSGNAVSAHHAHRDKDREREKEKEKSGSRIARESVKGTPPAEGKDREALPLSDPPLPPTPIPSR